MYPTKEETALWVALNRAQRAIYRSIDAALKKQNLPPLRWYDVLWELERAKGAGLRPFELEKKLIFEQSNLSRLLRRLSDEGLVRELAFVDDGRGKLLQITDDGRRIRRQMWKIYGPLINQHICKVPEPRDQERIAEALKSLTE